MTHFDPFTGCTIFHFQASSVARITLTGRFGQAEPGGIRMRWERGSWVAKLRLRPGKYNYAFQVDGVTKKRGRTQVQLDYRFLTDNVLLEISSTHTCRLHAHKWN